MVYLISSLPSLTFGQSPPISLENFHSDAKEQLSAENYDKLQMMDLIEISKIESGKLKSFIELIEQMHNDMIEIRNAKKTKCHLTVSALPNNMLEQNPLEREKSIMKWQWEHLTSIDFGETFSFTEVLVYKLKLQILHRLDSFSAKRGLEILESIVEPSKNMEAK